MTTNETPATITVDCEYCGGKHVGEYHHDDRWDGRALFEVYCPSDGLVGYYNTDAAI